MKTYDRVYSVTVPANQKTASKIFKTEKGQIVRIGATQCKACETNATMQLQNSGVKVTEVLPIEFLQRGNGVSNEAYYGIDIATDGSDFEIIVNTETTLNADHTYHFIIMYDVNSSTEVRNLYTRVAGNDCLI